MSAKKTTTLPLYLFLWLWLALAGSTDVQALPLKASGGMTLSNRV